MSEWDCPRLAWVGEVVKRGTGCHGIFQEVVSGLKAIRALLHADCSSSADDQDSRLRITGLGEHHGGGTI